MADAAKGHILAWLDGEAIPYRFFQHPRVLTIEDCLSLPFMDESTTFCRNLFLCNRQQTAFYVLLLRPLTPFRTAVVSKALGVSRLSFAPTDALERMLHVAAGAVSPLGLYFDMAHAILLCYEQAVRDTPKIAFHPCDSGATVVFAQEVFWGRVLPLLGVTPRPL